MNTYERLWSRIRQVSADAWSDFVRWESQLEREHYMLFASFTVLLIVLLFLRKTKPVSRSRRRARSYFVMLGLVVLLSFSGSMLFLPSGA